MTWMLLRNVTPALIALSVLFLPPGTEMWRVLLVMATAAIANVLGYFEGVMRFREQETNRE